MELSLPLMVITAVSLKDRIENWEIKIGNAEMFANIFVFLRQHTMTNFTKNAAKFKFCVPRKIRQYELMASLLNINYRPSTFLIMAKV